MSDPYDAVVVGSGAGGGVVAKELAEAGLEVAVLEAGPRFDPSGYPGNRRDFELIDPFPSDPARDRVTNAGEIPFEVSRIKGVGGSTLKYLAVSPRLHESDFRTRTEDGVGDDWPIRYEDLEPYYTRVEYELGVSGDDRGPHQPPRSRPFPTPPHPLNCAGRAIRAAGERIGIHVEAPVLAIPTRAWNGRPACRRAGACQLGCRWRSKSSIDVTYVPRAEATGRLDLRSRCMAREITLHPDGRARGVVYFGPDGEEREVTGRVVVVAGGAIETPRLLLMSASGGFPEGLANSSGLVGRYLMEHVGTITRLRLPRRVDPWDGPPALASALDFYETDPRADHARGFIVEVGAFAWPYATARHVGGWGRAHKEGVRDLFGRFVTLTAVGEQLPDAENRVDLDPEVTDSYGLPVPRIRYRMGENDRALIERSAEVHRRLADAANAEVLEQHPHEAGDSRHYLGTCRMGNDPSESVVDSWGGAHDVPNLFIADGSVLVTGGAVNPALTISALAARTSDRIVHLLRAGEIS